MVAALVLSCGNTGEFSGADGGVRDSAAADGSHPLDAGRDGAAADGSHLSDAGDACESLTCDALGATCGQVDDGCGQTLRCGGCGGDSGQVCYMNQCRARPFVHIHASGRFDYGVGSDDQARRERRRLARDAADYRDHASIVTHTEMGRPQHANTILGSAGEAWRSFRHPEGDGPSENAVEWNAYHWVAMNERVVRLAERRIPARRLFATVVRLRERLGGGRLGRTVIVMVTHMPASVEGNWDRDTTKVLAYKEALAGWRRLRMRMRERFPNAALILAADWNLNHKRSVVRRRIRNGLGGDIVTNWPPDYSGMGTFKSTGRVIDANWHDGPRRRRTRVLGDVLSSDHHPYLVKYTFD